MTELFADRAMKIWPSDQPCHALGCGHRRDHHLEPLDLDGRCWVEGCRCLGWDPLTREQWRQLFAEGTISSPWPRRSEQP